MLLAALLTLAALPWGAFRTTVQSQLSERFGRPVTVGAVERVDRFGLHPTVAIRDLRIPQAGWAGRGELARVTAVTVQFPALPLLLGRFRPDAITVDGARLALVRDRTGRTNWEKPDADKDADKHGGGSGGLDLRRVTVRDTIVDYRDAKRDRALRVAVTADDTAGLRATGRGTVRGSPVAVTVAGPPVRGGRWPVFANLNGAALAMTATGTMDRPLDTGHMTLKVTARATDLRYIDAVIEAGLTGTQPVRLRADVRHDGPKWVVTNLKGTVGRSDIAGRVTVDKSSGRNVIDGAVEAGQLDFADFASDESLARAAALIAREGPRVVPSTPIDLKSVRHTDGRITFRARRVVSRAGPSSIASLAGTVTVDHQLMTVAPLTIGLRKSAIRGEVTVDQRGGAQVPLVTLDLRLADSDLGSLSSDAASVGGRADAVAKLRGRGPTIRAAVGNSDGRIGLIARGGGLSKRIAAALGFDLGKAALADKNDRAGLRCFVAAAELRGGRGRVEPLVIDTTQSQAKGSGTLTFPGETLALSLTGAPKQSAVLRVPGAVVVSGRLKAPDVGVTKETKSAGNILKAVGRAIFGGNGPKANDANCDALAARVLR